MTGRAAAAVPARPPRDLRLDVLRGWMQVSIFVSHVAGTAFASGIHASWGLSDSSEQFVLLSGLSLGSVFALKAARDGAGVARADLLRRTARLTGAHAALFAAFAALVLLAQRAVPLPGEAERLGFGWLVEEPWEAIPAAATLLYQPAFMGILPIFIWCMMALPAFLWLADRVGAWALLPSLLLYGAVQPGWIATPAIGGDGIAFDPLAWQLLFMTGAYCGRRTLLEGVGVPRRPWLVGAAGAVVAFGLRARLVGYGVLPGPEPAAAALLLGKEVLAPPRLLHALSLAYLVAVLVPREARWMHSAPALPLAAIGRRSLRVFCFGVPLAWAASTALAQWPGDAPWLDPALVLGGVAALAAIAYWPPRRGREASRRAPVRAAA